MLDNILYDLKDLKIALKNDLISIDENFNFEITNVVFDNREIFGKSLFIAKKGEKNDGHIFIKDTIENTEAVVLAEYIPDNVKQNSRIILVKNTMDAFKSLAVFSRNRLKGNVIGITGSVGKTSTKDMFFESLSTIGKSFCNQQSFNNYIGVLTTLANTPKDTKFAIYEMGVGDVGEMDTLRELIKPNITIILNIYQSHIVYFKTEESIADEKSKIFDKNTECVILNSDNKMYDYIKNKAVENNIKQIKTFGTNDIADIKLNNYKIENNKASIEYILNNKTYNLNTNNLDYNISFNFLSLLTVADYLNIDINKIIRSVENYNTTRGRNNIEYCSYDFNNEKINLTLINGSYNAVNPQTFITGLKLMDNIYAIGKNKRKVCIWGDMLETGDKAEEFHLSLKEYILNSKIDLILTVGSNMKILHKAINKDIKSIHFDNIENLLDTYKNYLQNNDLVFIKSSKGIKLYKLLNALVDNKMKLFV